MHRLLFWMGVLWLPAAVPAQIVTYLFSGTLDTVNVKNNLYPEGYVGESFSGWFRYASDSPVTESGAIAFTLGSIHTDPLDQRLYLPVSSTSMSLLFYGSDDGIDYGRTGFVFVDHSGAAFANPSRVPTEISLSMFDSVKFYISGYCSAAGSFSMSGQVTGLELVPEPATMLMLGIGGLALRARSRR